MNKGKEQFPFYFSFLFNQVMFIAQDFASIMLKQVATYVNGLS
ncbi:hypothetical protein BN1184_BC_00350 [Pantoea ananatis]|nr:hypothetical protein BN1182_BN_00170 [Pantoea ananatis]CRH34342.1 hypothetical protein BN1183_BE_00130 [Pantoea ananatis]CRH38872.1 hypothetical protein BN1184_BC_00350 [Pantoea ananatis]